MCSYAFVEDQQGSHSSSATPAPVTTVLGTTDGQLYFMNKNFELRGLLEESPTKDLKILCIAPQINGRGFVVAGDSKKLIQYNNENVKDIKIPYTKVETPIQNKMFDNIYVNSLVFLNDNYMVAGLRDGRLIRIKVSSDKQQTTQNYEFTNLVSPFHSGNVNDMDLAVMKPLLATCSSDRSVKIWNYETK